MIVIQTVQDRLEYILFAPGEKITSEILDYIRYSKERGCMMTGTEDMDIENIKVIV